MRSHVTLSRHARACGHPVRSGFSARLPASLEYWIVWFAPILKDGAPADPGLLDGSRETVGDLRTAGATV